MIIRLPPKFRRLMFSMVIMSMCFIPFVKGQPSCSIPYWECGVWNSTDWVSSPQVIQTTLRYHSPNHSAEIPRVGWCLGFSFINQSFKYDSCNRLNISFWQWTYSNYYVKTVTKNNITLWSSSGYPTGWTYRSFDLPYSISGDDFIEFLNDGGGLCTSSFIDDVYIHCEDPYSSTNWIDNGDFETLILPTTTTTTIPTSSSCDDLYIITDRGILVLLESSLQFVINLIQCWSPLWLFIFLASIGGILLMAFKNLARQ